MSQRQHQSVTPIHRREAQERAPSYAPSNADVASQMSAPAAESTPTLDAVSAQPLVHAAAASHPSAPAPIAATPLAPGSTGASATPRPGLRPPAAPAAPRRILPASTSPAAEPVVPRRILPASTAPAPRPTVPQAITPAPLGGPVEVPMQEAVDGTAVMRSMAGVGTGVAGIGGALTQAGAPGVTRAETIQGVASGTSDVTSGLGTTAQQLGLPGSGTMSNVSAATGVVGGVAQAWRGGEQLHTSREAEGLQNILGGAGATASNTGTLATAVGMGRTGNVLGGGGRALNALSSSVQMGMGADRIQRGETAEGTLDVLEGGLGTASALATGPAAAVTGMGQQAMRITRQGDADIRRRGYIQRQQNGRGNGAGRTENLSASEWAADDADEVRRRDGNLAGGVRLGRNVVIAGGAAAGAGMRATIEGAATHGSDLSDIEAADEEISAETGARAPASARERTPEERRRVQAARARRAEERTRREAAQHAADTQAAGQREAQLNAAVPAAPQLSGAAAVEPRSVVRQREVTRLATRWALERGQISPSIEDLVRADNQIPE